MRNSGGGRGSVERGIKSLYGVTEHVDDVDRVGRESGGSNGV
jgi:hypothetical protein